MEILLPEYKLSYHGEQSLFNHIYIGDNSKGGALYNKQTSSCQSIVFCCKKINTF